MVRRLLVAHPGRPPLSSSCAAVTTEQHWTHWCTQGAPSGSWAFPSEGLQHPAAGPPPPGVAPHPARGSTAGAGAGEVPSAPPDPSPLPYAAAAPRPHSAASACAGGAGGGAAGVAAPNPSGAPRAAILQKLQPGLETGAVAGAAGSWGGAGGGAGAGGGGGGAGGPGRGTSAGPGPGHGGPAAPAASRAGAASPATRAKPIPTLALHENTQLDDSGWLPNLGGQPPPITVGSPLLVSSSRPLSATRSRSGPRPATHDPLSCQASSASLQGSPVYASPPQARTHPGLQQGSGAGGRGVPAHLGTSTFVARMAAMGVQLGPSPVGEESGQGMGGVGIGSPGGGEGAQGAGSGEGGIRGVSRDGLWPPPLPPHHPTHMTGPPPDPLYPPQYKLGSEYAVTGVGYTLDTPASYGEEGAHRHASAPHLSHLQHQHQLQAELSRGSLGSAPLRRVPSLSGLSPAMSGGSTARSHLSTPTPSQGALYTISQGGTTAAANLAAGATGFSIRPMVATPKAAPKGGSLYTSMRSTPGGSGGGVPAAMLRLGTVSAQQQQQHTGGRRASLTVTGSPAVVVGRRVGSERS